MDFNFVFCTFLNIYSQCNTITKGELKMKNERIIAATVKYRAKGETEFKYTHGINHSQCFNYLATIELPSALRDMDNEEQGFTTSKARFVSREEAVEIARNSGQLSENFKGNRLTSEDLISY